MSQEYEPQPPSLNKHRAALTGPMSPVAVGGDSYIYLTRATLGWSPILYPVIIIQAVGAATVAVMGLDGATWCPYPGSAGSLDAGDIAVIRGRWTALRVATESNIWVKGDLDFTAYNGGGL